jgi:hypothetical protein
MFNVLSSFQILMSQVSEDSILSLWHITCQFDSTFSDLITQEQIILNYAPFKLRQPIQDLIKIAKKGEMLDENDVEYFKDII